MRFATLAAAFSAPLLVAAVPTKYRRAEAIDIKILQFADTLERFETKLYDDALKKFDAKQFKDAGFSDGNIPFETIGDILIHESNHTVFLDGVLKSLGAEPIADCSFKFDDVLKDIPTFIAFGRVVEVVGIGAYLGAAKDIVDKGILVAAGTIVTIEGRHQSSMNTLSGTVAVPQAFDTPLAAAQVTTLVQPFLVGCKGFLDLFPPPTPALAVANAKNFVVDAGSLLKFNVENKDTFCQIFVGDGGKARVCKFNECTAPNDVFGTLIIFQTKSAKALDNAAILKNDPNEILAGPAIAFINKEDTLGQLVLPIGSVQSSDVISPNQAYGSVTEAAAPTPVPSAA